MRLKGKRALVTAAGQGIGRASAEAMIREGAQVFATDINMDTLGTLEGAETFLMDARDPAQITAAAEREIIRRQEAMRRADEAALRAQRQMADGNYEAAMGSSRSALGGGR